MGEGIGSQLIESERLGLFQVQRLCLDPRLVQRRRRDSDAERDGERKRQTVVVIGVLADQVDPPGGECDGSPGHACAGVTEAVKVE